MKRRWLAVLPLAAAAAGCAPLATPMERGLSLYDQGYYLSAVMAFDEAVRQSPESSMAHTNRGVARMRTGDTRGALEDFTRASELSPRDPEVWFNRGNVNVARNDLAAAIADFTRAVELRPGFSRALFNRGIARHRGGDDEGAR
ncbi:MAG: tetratricopeptide repeat protein, partial [Candidatus Rokuibacteriota bacterium]